MELPARRLSVPDQHLDTSRSLKKLSELAWLSWARTGTSHHSSFALCDGASPSKCNCGSPMCRGTEVWPSGRAFVKGDIDASPPLRAWRREASDNMHGCLRPAGCRRHRRKWEGSGPAMDVLKEVARLLDDVLSLGGRSAGFTRQTALMGAVPELDSMAVVSLITAMEERLGILVDDDDINGDTFASVGSLADFVADKLTT